MSARTTGTVVTRRTVLIGLIAFLASFQLSHAIVDDAIAQGETAGALSASRVAASPDRNSIGMRFVEVPAGSFDMGSDVRAPEQPVHRVSVAGFWMGVTEVTQAQWQAVMGSNPSHFKQAGPDAPVEMVTWEDAQAFIRKLNALEPDRRYRLPSEAEWEYACRAGMREDPYGPVEAIAWVAENSGGTTHPVGLKQPNAFGLHDMFGNVPEWVQDTWHPDYKGAPTDGSASEGTDSPYHPLRGGGWDLPTFFVRAALRDPWGAIHRRGFRVAYVPAKWP
ncbi:MAG: formylglycine-generating enzyme family protein [Acidobacteria bacterium]|nr:MAG: formylglycine-generating enzyme family protein [Acidobacteriota bacterium]